MSVERARQLRANPTEAERQLWSILYTFRRQGYHFRRQTRVGPYYADFACLHAHLIIEADGVTHTSDNDAARDEVRTAYLQQRGFTLLRFWNDEISDNPEGVFAVIAAHLQSVPPLTPTPVPSPQGGGRPRTRKLRMGLAELAARTGDRS